jgi:erythronate-4-phosphate dehydrogenase
MKIYYDENMPFAPQLFADLGEVQSFAGRECHANLVKDADVLLVRSITQVNESLLAGADNLKFVGTATIGMDHIDQNYLAKRQIAFASAPGCNAVSVAEYVLSAIKVLESRYRFSLKDKIVGIVGAGNTGSRLAEKLTALGVSFVMCDPPLANNGDSRKLVSYEYLLSVADIISFHVPLVTEGDYPTHHLFGEDELAVIKPDAVIMTACRGEVIDNKMLLRAKQGGNKNPLVLDVWEGEPQVLHDLIPYADIATAHIAGYSFEGKARGTYMLYQALCQYLGIAPNQCWDELLPKARLNSISIDCAVKQPVDFAKVDEVIHKVYDVRRDDAIFRQNIASKGFDWIRKNYPERREFGSLAVHSAQQGTLSTLINLGFKRGE